MRRGYSRRKTSRQTIEFNVAGKPKEHYEQRRYFQWVKANAQAYPALLNIYAIPNGGDRNPRVAAMMKLEGTMAGVCDIEVAAPRKAYPGLYIEMKEREGGDLSKEQKDWISRLRSEGYRVEVAAGFEEARSITCWYLDIPDTYGDEHYGRTGRGR